MKNHGRTPIPVRRSDSIRQRTEQNGVGSHIDAVSLEILALTSITERGYWGIELGGHTHLRLDQIDQVGKRLHIWRLKRRQPQIYPLVPSVGEALSRYIDEVRPNVAHAEVFIRVQAPRIPILATAIYNIIARKLLRTAWSMLKHQTPFAMNRFSAA